MPTMKGCSFCSASIPVDAVTCPKCNASTRLTATHYCIQCGSVGFPKHYAGGSFIVAGLLFFISLFVPLLFLALIAYFAIWAFASYTGCAQCKAKTIVPVTSPVAQAALKPPTDKQLDA